jgi:WD40 repeat protein
MCIRPSVLNVWCSRPFTTSLLPNSKLLSIEAHGDAVWDICWTAKDNAVVSISADGVIKRWNSTSGQVMRTGPAHTLGLVSLSVSPDGGHALYNSIDGTTFLWDLEGGAVVGKYESYTRSGSEPCKSCVHTIPSSSLRNSEGLPFLLSFDSMVRILEPQRRHVCSHWWVRKRYYPFSGTRNIWRATCYPPEWAW